MNLHAASILCNLPNKTVVNVAGFPVVIEYPKGSTRELKNDAGETVYKKHMYSDYGYFQGTKGRDGDEVDVMVGPVKTAKEIYVVHMRDMGPDVDQREDEDKVMLGYPSANAAKQAFLLHYPSNFYQSMSVLSVPEFRKRMATASLPYREKKIHASSKCPKCGSNKYGLMPTDFETAKCSDCGKTWNIKAEREVSRKRRVEHYLNLGVCPHCINALSPAQLKKGKCKHCGKYLRV